MDPSGSDPASRPLRRDAQRNRERILAAAGELFAEHGLRVRLDEIAHRADVGVGTVYRHFESREALIIDLFRDEIEAVARIAEEAAAMEDPWEGFLHFLRRVLENEAGNRALRELLLGGAQGVRAIGLLQEGRDRLVPLVADLVSRAQADGRLRADLAPQDILLAQVMIGGAADFAREVNPEVWRRLAIIVIDGLRTRRNKPTEMPVGPLTDDEAFAAMEGISPRSAERSPDGGH